MKNRNFFSKFLSGMSIARKINLIIACIFSFVDAISIVIAWNHQGVDLRICVLGFLFGFLFPMAIWGCIDDILAQLV